MTLEDAINLIFEERCLLFLGSGFSRGAINVQNEPIPTARELSDKLDSFTGLQNEGNLEEATECYIDQNGEYQLIPLLRNSFTVKDTTPSQNIIGSCHWSRIYTTNYDDVIETASRKSHNNLTPVTLSYSTRDFKDKRSTVIHLNGSIYNLKTESLSDEFKLSASSYTTQSFLNSEWITLFRYDIQDADAIFFIGYSMQYDLDIKRIICEDEQTKNKCFFIMAQGENEMNVRKASRYGNVEAIGLDVFSQMITKQKKKFVPPTVNRPLRYLCFESPLLSMVRPTLSDSDVHKLYYNGIESIDIIRYSIDAPHDFCYYVKRNMLETTIKQIQKNGVNSILVHSDLGNGKTLFLSGLSLLLLQAGYSVFIFKKYMASLHREIEDICKKEDNKIAIIIENYATNLEVISELALHRTDQLLIVSERTVNNDMAYDKLVEKFKKDFYSVDLNVLSKEERKTVIDIFNQYGLWSSLSASNDFEKDEYIVRKCRNSFRGVLLGLLRSPNIISRFEKILSVIKQKQDFYESVVLLLASKLFELNLNIEMLSTALDETILGNAKFQRNDVVRELFNFQLNEVKVKSSVLAEVLLEKIIDSEIIKDVLVKTFKNFDKHRYDEEYKRVLKTLLSFSNLKRIMNLKGNNKYQGIMVSFFEDIRNCHFSQNNPHYWLQYAILKLDQHDFNVAETFFNNAYSYASKRKDFDAYQIDNHYARYLLVNAIEAVDERDFMLVFRKAHEILIEPSHQKDTKYYPFKVAQNYWPFYEKYKCRMKKEDKEFFHNSCQVILNMIDRFVQSTPEYKYRCEVREARKRLEHVLQDKIS